MLTYLLLDIVRRRSTAISIPGHKAISRHTRIEPYAFETGRRQPGADGRTRQLVIAP